MKSYLSKGIIIIQVLLIISLSRGLWETWQSRRRVEKLQDKHDQLMVEQEKLKDDVERVESNYYVEQIAREQLHMTKPGETLVMIADGVNVDVLGQNDQKKGSESIFSKWMTVLFGKE